MDEVLKIGIQIPRDKGMGTDILTHWEGEGRSVLHSAFQSVGLEIVFEQTSRGKLNQCV